jgi:hypothetical protein
MPVLALPEQLFDLLPGPLGQLVPKAPHAHLDARMRGLMAAGVRRDVGLEAAPEQRLDEADGEEALVPAEGGGREAQPAWARCSNAKLPAVSDATDRKISGPKPRRIRCRFSMRALTV